jgi:hypothetical protein
MFIQKERRMSRDTRLNQNGIQNTMGIKSRSQNGKHRLLASKQAKHDLIQTDDGDQILYFIEILFLEGHS